MDRIKRGLVCLALVCAACVTPAPHPTAPSAGQTYTGEVWVWDEQRSTVTLRRLTEIIRIKVSPDQLRGLRLHETATVRGEVEASTPIQHDVFALIIAEPHGPADQTEIAGPVDSVAPGMVRVAAPGGSVQVWTAVDGATFRVGDPVRVAIRVQLLALRTVDAAEAARTATPTPAPGPQPGHYAAVRGRIVDVQPGRLTVGSPRGPIVVAVPSDRTYAVGDAVEVHTTVSPVR